MNALAPSLAGQGRLQEAKAVQLEADASSRRCRHLLYLGIGQRQLAAILWRSGELGEAERAARAAVDTLDFSPPLRAHALATLTQIHVSLRRPDA